MSECCIGFGQFSSLQLYVIYCFLSQIIGQFLLSFKSIKRTFDFGIFLFAPELANHNIIQSLYNYIGFIIFGAIFHYFFVHKKNKHSNRSNDDAKLLKKKLIYNEDEMSIEDEKYKIIIICFIYVIYYEINILKYTFGLGDLDFWILNILFILIFMSYRYKIKQYKHQLISLIFIFIIDLILLIYSSIIPRYSKNVYEQVEELFQNKLYSIPIILISILLCCLISYARVESKVIMEKKNYSPYKLIILIGIIGIIIISISLTISSIFICDPIFKDICKVYINKNNKKYYDNILIYFSNLKNQTTLELLIEILVITPLFTFANFMKVLFEILIIYYLNPIYVLINEALVYGTLSILAYILNDKEDRINKKKFIINVTLDNIAIIGYFIYLEIIELRFCGFNKDVRSSISQRGKIESSGIEIGNIGEPNSIDESFDDENGSVKSTF